MARAASSYDLDPDNASILVAGGGGTALHVTRKLKDMGSWVWQLQRTDNHRKEIEGMMAMVARGDATNAQDVERVFGEIEELDAVVSTLGGTIQDPLADSQGNINLIRAAVAKGVKKFVLVTSLGCGSSKGAVSQKMLDILQPVLVEKEKAEAELMSHADKMAFVIIRPGGLQSAPATGGGVLTSASHVCGPIAREDVAGLAVKALFSKQADNKVLSAVDAGKLPGCSAYEVLKL